MSITLPVYDLTNDKWGTSDLTRLAENLFGLEKVAPEQRGDRLVVAGDDVDVELFPASGMLHAVPKGRLLAGIQRPPKGLPSAERVYELAAELLERHGLALVHGDAVGAGEIETTPLKAGGAFVATRTDRGSRNQFQVEVAARYAVTLANPGVEGEPDRIPVVGGGGKLTLSFGEEERLAGLHRAWRPVTGRRGVDALDRNEAIGKYLEANSHLDIREPHASLAYYAAPGDTAQELLTPVWVVGGFLDVDKERVPMRRSLVAATEFGPATPPSWPQEPRKRRPRPSGSAAATGAAAAAGNPSEVGTSWIGTLGGLNGSQQNAQGFVDGFAKDGWTVNFNWGNQNAWQSDWDANDDDWVDAADFVFYTGHANLNGWQLVTPGTTTRVLLTPSVVGSSPQTPGDHWGAQDLEWVIVAACGPLQDDVIAAGGGDVLTRWDGAFDGLHTLMGYGSITYDNTDEGRKVSQYSREGTPVIDAWFRTAQEVQPSTNGESAPDGPDVWVGAMYVVRPGADPRQDHVWGHGSVAPDPTSPTTLVCTWVTC